MKLPDFVNNFLLSPAAKLIFQMFNWEKLAVVAAWSLMLSANRLPM
jgi:hypothetical protein